MKIETKGTYDKSYANLWKSYKSLTKETMELFIENPHHPALRNHPLDPPLERYRSISIDDYLRILFRMIDPSTALFLKIGKHDEIYERI